MNILFRVQQDPARLVRRHRTPIKFANSSGESVLLLLAFHRISGFTLYFGVLLIAWWLIAAASGPNAYANFEWFMGSLIGRLVLFGYTWALLHHMLGGIRHLIWDLGLGFEPTEREFLALATIVGSISLTLIVWVVGYLAMGGPR